ncbi:hypothetical protein FHS92_001359 [Sphingobium subterraneum]|uniref:Uncharacterized protein n=1 Tax=Sphingobium subterraneum TaxID=627688 RepID=A0A841IZ69_9SPHN|nr:hypothetical protein [Sphingobium subterraneum]
MNATTDPAGRSADRVDSIDNRAFESLGYRLPIRQ